MARCSKCGRRKCKCELINGICSFCLDKLNTIKEALVEKVTNY